MIVNVDVPNGTMLLLKAQQLHRKDKAGKVIGLSDIIVSIIEKHFRESPETELFIKQTLKGNKK